VGVYIYKIVPVRPSFVTDATPQEQAVMGEHFAYLKGLLREGRLLLAGRTEEATYGIVIFEADSIEAARTLMEGDPAVAEGIMRAELNLFRLALSR